MNNNGDINTVMMNNFKREASQDNIDIIITICSKLRMRYFLENAFNKRNEIKETALKA